MQAQPPSDRRRREEVALHGATVDEAGDDAADRAGGRLDELADGVVDEAGDDAADRAGGRLYELADGVVDEAGDAQQTPRRRVIARAH